MGRQILAFQTYLHLDTLLIFCKNLVLRPPDSLEGLSKSPENPQENYKGEQGVVITNHESGTTMHPTI